MNFILIFVGVLFSLMALGVPVGIVLMLCGMTVMTSLGMHDPRTVAQNMIQGLNNYVLMAIPFFILAGELMGKGGLTRRIVAASKVFAGRIRGSLGYTTIVATIIFSGLSGSAVADAAAIGTMLIPLMVASGYNSARSGALVASCSVITPLIPPSTGFILIGVSCNLSIARLFMGGIVPGFIFGIALMIGWYFIAKLDGYKDQQTFTRQEAKVIVIDAIPALVMPVLVICGIRFGLFTPTEAGAFCVVYALFVCNFFYKELNWQKTKEALLEAAITTAAVALIVAGATVFGYYMTIAQLPALMVKMLGGFIDRPILLLFIINIFMLVIGMFMDMTPNILIFSPILMPIAKAAGIDPYFFAFIFCVNVTIGLFTPPVGTTLFVLLRISRTKYSDFVYKTLPFYGILLAVFLLYVFFPQLYLAPLKLLYGR